MSPRLGTYTFFPWLRQGLANRISAADMDAAVQSRVTVNVKIKLSGQPIGGGAAREHDFDRDVALYGPGDVVGIDTRAIVKVEPRHWITNFEPNYLPYVEFYDEDFPWRYTPATRDEATKSRLRPWIMLAVLKEDEFDPSTDISGRPLPFIKLKKPATEVFPPTEHLWAWAHVHVNRGLIADPNDVVVGPDENAPVLTEFEAVLRQNPDLAYSRIVSPRRLEENTAYHAFLVPVFETGRLAGLGLDPAGAPHATFSAWEIYDNRAPDDHRYPYYYRWYFRTGTVGDFEYLVRLLEPKPMDSRVGRRDMDVQHPGANLPGITDAALGGVLKLGGALQISFATLKDEDKREVLKYENVNEVEDRADELPQGTQVGDFGWDRPYPHPFQQRLAEFINLADSYARKTVADAHDEATLPPLIAADPNPDPLITPPLYGRWHALTQRLLKDAQGNPIPDGRDIWQRLGLRPGVRQDRNWVHELNLDPRFRVAAGFGTDVAKKNQETYMEAAWEQVGDVLEANQQIRWGQLASEVSWIWYDKHLRAIQATSIDAFLGITAPLDKRVVLNGTSKQFIQRAGSVPQTVVAALTGATRHFFQRASFVPRTVLSAPMRRIARPRGRLIRALRFPATILPKTLISRLNSREVLPGPPKVTPRDLPTVESLAESMEPPGVPRVLLSWLDSVPWLRYFLPALLVIVLVLLVILALPGLGVAGALAAAAAGVALAFWLARRLGEAHRRHRAADALRVEKHDPAVVDEMTASRDFVLTAPAVPFVPSLGATDSPEATRFKTALRDLFELTAAARKAAAEPPKVARGLAPPLHKVALDLGAISRVTFDALNPRVTVPRRVLGRVIIPARIRDRLVETFVEAMAYPEFDIPMYKPLADLSAELFLPNINFVEQNSISLLETNQRFIEAYMVGLNHEFGRELLWREYPTDQRGSYFRQFWDVSSFLDLEGLDPEALREKLRDIPPLHRWSRSSALGDHDHRELPGESEEELVLVIRGELLKKYPTAVIYAQRAAWRTKDGAIDKAQPRDLVELTEEEELNPPPEKIRTPLYEAKVDPDIYFFGFDLTALEAKGETPEDPDDPGWFFVIRERPGEPRFGLDVDEDGAPAAPKHYWNDVSWADAMGNGGLFLSPLPPPGITLTAPPPGTPEVRQIQHQEDIQIVWDTNVSAAEMAYILYQVPVMVAVHAAEMLPK